MTSKLVKLDTALCIHMFTEFDLCTKQLYQSRKVKEIHYYCCNYKTVISKRFQGLITIHAVLMSGK